jgi:antitoxin component of RelBE/YafQ-DinJ toxin-antitoxin module
MTPDDRLGLRIPPELKRAAQEKAEAEDLTLSQVVRRLLRQWVAEEEQPEEGEGQEDK